MPAGGVEVREYEPGFLEGLLGPSVACRYLCAYLDALEVRSLVLESHYVDRHFLADFSAYYSRSFNAPPPFCKRLSLFTQDARRLTEILSSAFGSVEARDQRQLDLQVDDN